MKTAAPARSLCLAALASALLLTTVAWPIWTAASISRELPVWLTAPAALPAPPAPSAGTASSKPSYRLFHLAIWSEDGWELPSPRVVVPPAAKTRSRGFELMDRGSIGCSDFRNRLTRAGLSGVELATYVYDVSNLLVEVRPAGSAPRVTVWSGWQEIEEYLGGQLWQRRSYGLGLDELVRLKADLDQDGSLETDYAPLYDAAGNLAVLTGAQGQPVAKYFYSPFGDTMAAHVDASPSQVYQVLFKAGELWLEFSKEVLTAPFFEAVTSGEVYLEETAGGTRHALVASFPVGEGRQARQRVVLTPSTAPEAGVEVELVVASEATRDLFENIPPQAYSLAFPWPDAATPQAVLADTAAPEVEQVYLKDSHLEIELSETVDPEVAAQAILIGGAPTSWELLPDGYTLCTTSPLPPGSHSVEITTAPLDLSGEGLTTSFTTTAQVATTPTGEQLDTKPPATQVEFAALGNLFAYHGRPLDVATGLLYFRNRYYDPELGRFITADPLGYVDGPSQYVFAMNSPVVFGDPLGLDAGDRSAEAAERVHSCGVDCDVPTQLRRGLEVLGESAISRDDMAGATTAYFLQNLTPANNAEAAAELVISGPLAEGVGAAWRSTRRTRAGRWLSREVPLPKWLPRLRARTGPAASRATPWAPYLEEAARRVESKRVELGGIDAFGMAEVPRGRLLDELTQAGIKHSPEDVLRIARDPSGRVVFLESGNARAGLQHIVSRHAEDFARVGVSEAQIADLLITATTRGRVIGTQGGRPIYQVAFGGQTRRVAVTVADNGFIVGANPVGR